MYVCLKNTHLKFNSSGTTFKGDEYNVVCMLYEPSYYIAKWLVCFL